MSKLPVVDGEGAIRLSFSANMLFVRPVRHFIGALCDLARYDEEDTESISLVITEMLNNSIEHGSHSEDDEIDVHLVVGPGQFRFTVVDPGRGGAEFAHEAEDKAAEMPNLEDPRGRGLFLIRSYMDDLRVTFDPKTGTTFSVFKVVESKVT
ncbi:MAG: ATP-binding protein [Planctomycetota bacterium]|nr:ATP-binding protein [Planctomycetota bacterium]